MFTSKTLPLTRSLPSVLAALAIACSSDGERRSPAPGVNSSAAPTSDGIPNLGGATNASNPGGGSNAGGSNAGDANAGGATLGGAAPIPSAPLVAGAGPSTGGTSGSTAGDINGAGFGNSGGDGTAAGDAGVGVDSDADGLPDSVERNTHVFHDENDTGTDPLDWDSDDDGISDGDEVLPTVDGLNLAKMGTNPLHKDILIEYDWFDDSDECAAHSHRPTPAALGTISATFAASPVRNPDGTAGIHVIHDYGQGGLFNGGNRINDADALVDRGIYGSEFARYRSQNFAHNRQGYFHYALLPHRYTYFDDEARVWRDDSTGQADILGDSLLVALDCAHGDFDVASTIVHELGHNLNLRHGGDTDTNNKPNYNSIMNYWYQFSGVDTNCTPDGDGVIDYSHNQRIALNEAALDERQGICGTSAWDWNNNGKLEARIAVDLNDDGVNEVLSDHDDWSAILLDWHGPPSIAKKVEGPRQIATCAGTRR
ncbi:MAG TPA: hypothetical protein VER96_30195 [Polyangiaceae bacterium]|nr:hypothetical protein [Polyangiaceae bacterium]